ncbi:hypothetical protein MBLNU13_g11327t1 [Cladosporium sp. NU13]
MNASGFFQAARCGSTDSDAGYYTTAFRFLVKHRKNSPPQRTSSTSIYRWEKLGFTTFHPSPKFFTILCLDVGDDARAHLHQQILGSKLAFLEAHPLSIHLLVLRYILESFDRAVWSWRDVVRELETSRLHRRFATARDFDHMHEIARHLIHSTEMLTTALSVVECMINECEVVSNGSDGQALSACRTELHFVSSLMKALLHRSGALEKRMENEIALAFHTNAQHDTSIASQIALTSQRDGQTTKGISILGMLFLPGTYISALFSMSFFHFAPSADGGSEQWTVSPKFWMYWVVTIPVTALTIGIWFVVQRRHSSDIGSVANSHDISMVDTRGQRQKAKSDTNGSTWEA